MCKTESCTVKLNMKTAREVVRALRLMATEERARANRRYFKTGRGEYGEGDKFLGVTVPATRVVAKQATLLSFAEIQKLLTSPLHEVRLCGVLILVAQFNSAGELNRKKIYNEYLLHIPTAINNWDLVDTSAPNIVGAWLNDKPKVVLAKLANSKNLWERRVAIVATLFFIRAGDYTEAFRIADILLNDKHDLIHKATGWMLREVGKNSGQDVLEEYLLPRVGHMPRTMLRYALERFPKQKRAKLLNLGR